MDQQKPKAFSFMFALGLTIAAIAFIFISLLVVGLVMGQGAAILSGVGVLTASTTNVVVIVPAAVLFVISLLVGIKEGKRTILHGIIAGIAIALASQLFLYRASETGSGTIIHAIIWFALPFIIGSVVGGLVSKNK